MCVCVFLCILLAHAQFMTALLLLTALSYSTTEGADVTRVTSKFEEMKDLIKKCVCTLCYVVNTSSGRCCMMSLTCMYSL